jgi:hypothetical protein
MKGLRIVGLSLAAVLTVAIFASSASAEPPEYGRCLKTTGGNFKNAKCTVASVPGEEKYEWFPGVVKNKFTTALKEGTLITFEDSGGAKLSCTGATGEGEITGPKTTIGSYVFTGCETSKIPCNTAGAPLGTLIGNTLEGLLGLEAEGSEPSLNKVANGLFPAESGSLLVQFECSGLKVVAKGSVLNPTSENGMLSTVTVKWTATKAKQKPEKFLNEPSDICTVSLNGGPFEQCGGTLTMILTLEEKIEINTVV